MKPDTADRKRYRQRYRSIFPACSSWRRPSKAALAYQTALDIRKFEIDLYWKRAAYFWAFVGAAFAAYLAILTQKVDETSIDPDTKPQALLLATCIGLIFSTAWYLVNRASKYWQLNWEFHVDMLEDGQVGPLYKVLLEDKSAKIWNPEAPYPFSVSKINQWLSFFFVILFAGLVVDTCVSYYRLTFALEKIDWFPTLLVLGTVLALAAMVGLGRVSSKISEVRVRQRKTNISEWRDLDDAQR